MVMINAVINLLASVALFAMMATVGLGVNLRDVLRVAGDWRLTSRAAIANFVLVPTIAFGLLIVFRPAPMVAAGFLIAVVCPGAPFGPPLTALARGNVCASVGLMAILAGSSAVLVPLLLSFLMPRFTSAETGGAYALTINPMKIVSTLMLTQFLPLCLGLVVRQFRPAIAEPLRRSFARLSIVLNMVLIVLILFVQWRMLETIRTTGYLGMGSMVAAMLVVGWLFGGRDPVMRKTLAITTSTRNVGVALVITSATFPGTAAVPAATAFALFQIFSVLLVAGAWGRLGTEQEEEAVEKAAA